MRCSFTTKQTLTIRRVAHDSANHPVWRKETYHRSRSTGGVAPGWSTHWHDSPGVCWASDTVYLTFTFSNTESLTPPESQTKPRCSSALTSVCPRGDHISPPPPLAIMFLTPAWNTIVAKPICEIHSLWILSHAKFIEKPSRDLRHDILDPGRIVKLFDLTCFSIEQTAFLLLLHNFGRNTKIDFKQGETRMVTCLHRLLQCKPLWTFAFQKSKVKSVAWDSISSFYALVFLPGVWEQMTNDTEGSTSRSLKVPERYDLSLWLTRAISLHTYSKSWLNPSLFQGYFPPSLCLLHSPGFDLFYRIKICCLYEGAI